MDRSHYLTLQRLLVACLAVAALGFMLVPLYARRLQRVGLVAAAAVGLQIGGASGNLLDRLVSGHVTDYIPTLFALVFNLSDVALALSMVLAIIALFPGATLARRSRGWLRRPTPKPNEAESEFISGRLTSRNSKSLQAADHA